MHPVFFRVCVIFLPPSFKQETYLTWDWADMVLCTVLQCGEPPGEGVEVKLYSTARSPCASPGGLSARGDLLDCVL